MAARAGIAMKRLGSVESYTSNTDGSKLQLDFYKTSKESQQIHMLLSAGVLIGSIGTVLMKMTSM